MTSIECARDLSDGLPHLLFRHVFLLLLEAFYQLRHVSSLAVLHDYENFSLLFVDYAIIVAHDVGMMQLAEDVDLAD